MIKKQFHLQTAMTVIAIIAFIGFYISYDKHLASWWGCNVTVISLLVGIPSAIMLKQFLDNYTNRKHGRYFADSKFFTILSVGVCLFLLSGIYYTEPDSNWNEPQPITETNTVIHHHHYNDGYYYSRAGRSYSNSSYDWVNLFESDGESSTDSDDGGEGIIILALIILVVLLIIASAVIPHFWVLSGIMVITLMIVYWLNNKKYINDKT